MQLTKAVNNISESAMLNWKKPVKFHHLQKLVNQLILHGPKVVEMGKTPAVLFIKNISLDENWNVSSEKKSQDDGDIYLLKVLQSDFG